DRGLPRGDQRVRAEAPAAVEGAVSATGRSRTRRGSSPSGCPSDLSAVRPGGAPSRRHRRGGGRAAWARTPCPGRRSRPAGGSRDGSRFLLWQAIWRGRGAVRGRPYRERRTRLRRYRLPPLISYEEALALGEIEDHAEIEALVDRAFRVRTDHFGDSTDMCSLVNAKSGGCAEDCGFCSQSRLDRKSTRLNSSH